MNKIHNGRLFRIVRKQRYIYIPTTENAVIIFVPFAWTVSSAILSVWLCCVILGVGRRFPVHPEFTYLFYILLINNWQNIRCFRYSLIFFIFLLSDNRHSRRRTSFPPQIWFWRMIKILRRILSELTTELDQTANDGVSMLQREPFNEKKKMSAMHRSKANANFHSQATARALSRTAIQNATQSIDLKWERRETRINFALITYR